MTSKVESRTECSPPRSVTGFRFELAMRTSGIGTPRVETSWPRREPRGRRTSSPRSRTSPGAGAGSIGWKSTPSTINPTWESSPIRKENRPCESVTVSKRPAAEERRDATAVRITATSMLGHPSAPRDRTTLPVTFASSSTSQRAGSTGLRSSTDDRLISSTSKASRLPRVSRRLSDGTGSRGRMTRLGLAPSARIHQIAPASKMTPPRPV